MRRQKRNFEEARDMKFPESVPVLFFLSDESSELLPEWRDLHQAVIGGADGGKIVPLDGSHYLHYEYPGEIAGTFEVGTAPYRGAGPQIDPRG